ncbi:MAG: c-type cytochrome [Pseudomonadota bacterium]
MKQFLVPLICGAALAVSGVALADGDAAAGKGKAMVCAACHGADGNAAAPTFPKLAGQHADYTIKQLAEFKSGARANAIMMPQAAGLSDQDMADLAAFYAEQTGSVGVAGDGALPLGETIYRAGIPGSNTPACASCHGPNAAGVPGAGFPMLSGQHAAYTAAQLRAYRDGSRNTDPNGVMRAATKRMTDAEIDAVAAYIQGLY